MRNKIIICLKKAKKPLSIHQIACAIHEREINVLRELRKMEEYVEIIAIHLDGYLETSVYYQLRKIFKNERGV